MKNINIVYDSNYFKLSNWNDYGDILDRFLVEHCEDKTDAQRISAKNRMKKSIDTVGRVTNAVAKAQGLERSTPKENKVWTALFEWIGSTEGKTWFIKRFDRSKNTPTAQLTEHQLWLLDMNECEAKQAKAKAFQESQREKWVNWCRDTDWNILNITNPYKSRPEYHRLYRENGKKGLYCKDYLEFCYDFSNEIENRPSGRGWICFETWWGMNYEMLLDLYEEDISKLEIWADGMDFEIWKTCICISFNALEASGWFKKCFLNDYCKLFKEANLPICEFDYTWDEERKTEAFKEWWSKYQNYMNYIGSNMTWLMGDWIKHNKHEYVEYFGVLPLDSHIYDPDPKKHQFFNKKECAWWYIGKNRPEPEPELEDKDLYSDDDDL